MPHRIGNAASCRRRPTAPDRQKSDQRDGNRKFRARATAAAAGVYRSASGEAIAATIANSAQKQKVASPAADNARPEPSRTSDERRVSARCVEQHQHHGHAEKANLARPKQSAHHAKAKHGDERQRAPNRPGRCSARRRDRSPECVVPATRRAPQLAVEVGRAKQIGNTSIRDWPDAASRRRPR